jgi:hypothetical protein
MINLEIAILIAQLELMTRIGKTGRMRKVAGHNQAIFKASPSPPHALPAQCL